MVAFRSGRVRDSQAEAGFFWSPGTLPSLVTRVNLIS